MYTGPRLASQLTVTSPNHPHTYMSWRFMMSTDKLSPLQQINLKTLHKLKHPSEVTHFSVKRTLKKKKISGLISSFK